MFSKARWCVVHIWVLWLNIKHVNHRSYFHPLCTRREEVGNFFFLFHKKSEFWSCLVLQLTRNAQILLQHLLVPLGRETRHGNSSCNKPGCYLDNKKYWKLFHKYFKKKSYNFWLCFSALLIHRSIHPPPPSKTHFNTSKRHRSVSSSLLYSQHLFQCLTHIGIK